LEAQLDASDRLLQAHFEQEERDRTTRRETERELAGEIRHLADEVTELRDLLRVAKLSGKMLIGVATIFGGLIAWVVNLLSTRGH